MHTNDMYKLRFYSTNCRMYFLCNDVFLTHALILTCYFTGYLNLDYYYGSAPAFLIQKKNCAVSKKIIIILYLYCIQSFVTEALTKNTIQRSISIGNIHTYRRRRQCLAIFRTAIRLPFKYILLIYISWAFLRSFVCVQI